jgi:dolichol-phosphate mannosyltransferase
VKALVIVPTFNERATIGPLLDELLSHTDEEVEVLVVDDGSPDLTADVVNGRSSPRVHLHRRGHKQGLASAYVLGFTWALDRCYEAVVEMDGDLSHDPSAVPSLLRELDRADLVIGSRYVPGGAIENWSRFRRFLSHAGNRYARILLGFPVRDATSGFRAYRSHVLALEDLSSIKSEGYAFQIEMTHRMFMRGGRISEVPITFSERRWGRSKLSRGIVVEALLSVPIWAVRERVSRRARR